MHAGVRDAMVCDDGTGGFRAYVIPDEAYLDSVLGSGTAASALVAKWRKTFDLSQFDRKAAAAPVGFNTMGWNSSYTRQPIPLEDMREWVDETVSGILRLNPKSLLEIGCGTGMLVLRVAPHCERYVAVDQSPAVLARLKEQLREVPETAEHVEVIEREASDLHDFGENTFDTVVISSAAQFFPNTGYLSSVLKNAARVVKPGGHVFVGDVRNLLLWRVFASSVELFQAPDALPMDRLRDNIQRRLDRDPELVISPAFFLSLPDQVSKISRVDIRPLRGRADNEMTRFRFEAILHIGPSLEQRFSGDLMSLEERDWTLDAIRTLLKQHPKHPVGIWNIRNERIERDLAATAIIDSADDAFTVGKLRRAAEQLPCKGIHPENIADLEKENIGFAVFLSWAACRGDGAYDAFFIPKDLLQGKVLPAIRWPDPKISQFLNFANAPGQAKVRNSFTDQLMKYAAQNLPAENGPFQITLVDSFKRPFET